ncbi:multidrug transporter [Streptomyces sp. ERV7]|uniref:alpha/beta fold hydrolase n=1 Tax=Streptomyces sp. ERV7 TaxID=1322334 RepID=UPI0007F5024E|nr:alpha/beta hydrolase [Streptomyces sp. ERV7]OAR25897.1 multidrug transporter [Streptomyces sp. ERV7]
MSAARKTPVVLLHALSLDASMWDAQRRALQAIGHPVLAPHQRGFGSVPLGDEPPSLDVVADDLARTLDGVGAGPVLLAGSSMGAYTAMAFLRRHPGRTAGLALLSARATADSSEARAQRLRFAELVGDEEVRAGLIAGTTPMLAGATTRARRPEVLDRLFADAAKADPAALAWAQRAIADRPDSTETLRAAGMPAVVIAGEEDELVAAEESRHTAALLRRGRLVTLPGTGHLQPLEAPERVTRELLVLLDEIGTPAC